MRLSAPIAIVSIACALLTGCSDTPDPNDPSNFDPNAGYGTPGAYPGGYGTPPPQPGYPQPAPPGYPQPQPYQPPAPAPGPAPATAGGSATPIPAHAAGAAGPLLQALAGQQAPGMQPDGQPFAGNFQAGQTLEQPIQILPGRCYSVVGVGIGITELDVQIVLHQPPLPAYVAAQDQGSGPQAVLGGGGQCFKNPLPVGAPAKVIMKATAGAGLGLAQVYSK